jgi:hypothetical protein
MVVHVHHTRDQLHIGLHHALDAAVLYDTRQSHFPLVDFYFDVAGINLGVLGQPVTNVLKDPFI